MRSLCFKLIGTLFLISLLASCGGDTVTEEIPTPVVSVLGDVALAVGDMTTFTAETKNGTDASYTWESSKATVATVGEDGLVTAVAVGTAIITATGADTGAKGSWGIHVYEEATGGEPQVLVSGPIGIMIGETAQLEAVTVDGEDSGYTWDSSAEAMATVDDAGLVTSVATGPVTITATGADTGAEGSWNMYVYEEGVVTPPDPRVELSGPLSAFVGDELTFDATTVNGVDSGYTWESSEEDVATVDDAGVVTALAAGETMITATGVDTDAADNAGLVVIEVGPEIPFLNKWLGSGHSDATAEAFIHWDEDGEVSAGCAKCHSSYGYLDFLGEDGTEAGVVDNPAALGSVITCGTCHNDSTLAMDSVTFPSGEVVTGLGPEARCMQCHQGRQSTVSVNDHITAAAVVDDDTVSADLSFRNVHYFAAGATLMGTEVKGGYEYADMIYDGKFTHAPGFTACQQCHDSHSLMVKTDACGACHEDFEDEEDLAGMRMAGSINDFDGDGDVEEGVEEEIQGLMDAMYGALQTYCTEVGGKGIIWAGNYPYFFIDTNGNGEVDEGENVSDNRYDAWTARSIRASYNYQYGLKDPGAFAHNAKYLIQILYDSIADLATQVTVDMDGLVRNDSGHFDGSSEAFRHWDDDGVVQASCSRCHSGEGFKKYVQEGQDSATAVPITDGFSCDVCHEGGDYVDGGPRRYVAEVEFPSDVVIENDPDNPDDSFICMTCHQGRESGPSVDEYIAGGGLGFRNVHYLPAGAMLYGADAKVGYEFTGKTYEAKFQHYDGGSSMQCGFCHVIEGEEHSFHPELANSCTGCHSEAAGDLEKIRKNRTTDYDGDGNNTEPLMDELDTLVEALYAELQAVATASGFPIAYSSGSYPYFFADTDGNGVADPDEATYANSYKNWTEPMMKAAFNYQFHHKEPGAWAHNTNYCAQLLIDSIEHLGGDISGFNRP